MTWTELIVCSVSYLIGAIPFSWLFVRVLKGVDLRTVGSGNLGSTNAMRVLGVRWGIVIQVLDILKGWLPLFALRYGGIGPAGYLYFWHWYVVIGHRGFLHFGRMMSGLDELSVKTECMFLIIGLCAVLGHMFPVYLRFRGGKGVNTSIGVFLALAPKATFVSLAVGLTVLAVTRFVSLGSIMGAVVLPFAIWFFYREHTMLIVVAAALALLVVLMHRSNIRRLLAGTEPRLGSKIAMAGSHEGKPGDYGR